MEFGMASGFDPLNPEEWEDVTQAQIIAKKGAGLLARYKGSLKRTLLHTFPEFKGIYFSLSLSSLSFSLSLSLSL